MIGVLRDEAGVELTRFEDVLDLRDGRDNQAQLYFPPALSDQ
ncbi:MAG: hypothetical protein AB7O24_09245 [Kofleriaceae bacterium]